MSTIALSTPRRGPSPFRAIANYLGLIAAGVREGHAIATRYEQLARSSNSDLARLGIARADIPQVAASGRIGR